MANLDSGSEILALLHQVFKDTDDSGTCRAVLRGSSKGSSSKVPDDFAASVESYDITPTAPKPLAQAVSNLMPAPGLVDYAEELSGASSERDEKTPSLTPTTPATAVEGFPASVVELGMGPIPLQARQRAINTLRQDEQKSASRKQRGYSSSGTAFTVPGKRSEVKPFVIPSTVRNPYAQKYSQFSGEGQDPRKVKHFKIWFPFLNQNPLPLDIKVIASARVSEMIGYILYRFNEETALRGTSLDGEPGDYELRLSEMDGQPDPDLPALSDDNSIKTLGFDSLCLCKREVARKSGHMEGKATGFFYVHYPDGSLTLLQRRKGLTVGDVIKQALRKRGIRFGEYALEVQGQLQVPLDPNEEIADVEAAQRERVPFALIKKFALRRDIDRPRDVHKEELMGAVEHTLGMNQAHTFFVTKHGKYTHQTVEFRVADDVISVTSFHSTRSLLTKSKKFEIPMESVVACDIDERRPTRFIIVFHNPPDWKEWKEQTYEAKTGEQARDIVNKINGILSFKVSGKNSELRAKYQRETGK